MNDIDGPLAECPCCHRWLGERQIEWHLKAVYASMDLNLDSHSGANGSYDGDDDGDFDIGIEIDANIAPIEAKLDEIEEPLQQFPVEKDDIHLPNPLPEQHPLPHYTFRRNPHVTVEEWPEPPSDDPDSNLDEELDVDSQVDDGPDHDPEFVERDEPRLNDKELHELLEFDYGDLLDDKWVKMYK
ncbi:hypothetical protein FRC11_000743 [Ceratobasidium sp. 423]|nr:hypothetical protein FRC11_000743 [Ceratobasidium sp. 423]